VAAGNAFTCGIKANGTIACWGDDTYGQATPPTGAFMVIGVGADHACGYRDTGTLVCWGRNDAGQATPFGG
jgi:alpha-tubulin suppressor-like RCC1 family protein